MRTKTISQNGKFQANLNGIWTIFEYINLNNNKEAFDNSRGIIIIALCKIQRLSLFQKFVGEKWTLLLFFVLYTRIEKGIE